MPDAIRVLHVDDDESYGELVAAYLERENERFEVALAGSAAEGLDRVDRERPDCIVSDYDMPGADGVEFLESIRESYPDLPFVLFTGKGSEEVAGEAIAAGATDYLQKQPGSDRYELLANRIENAVEQYRSRRELERERSRMQFALEVTDAAVWTLDPDTGEMEMQPRVCPPFDSRIDSFGALLDRIHSEDRSHVRETVKAAGRSGESYSVQFRFPDEGDTRWGEMTGRTVREEGETPFQTGIVRDITTGKERQRRFETLTSNLPGMAYRCRNEPGWPMEDVRGNVAEFTGYTAAELEAGEVEWGREVLHPEDQDWVWDEVQSSLAPGESFELTYRIHTADGQTRWVWERGRGIYGPDDDLEAIEGFITDVTERRRHETELEAIRDRMEFALGRTDSVIWEWDPETSEVTSFPDPCPLFGESIGSGEALYAKVHEADRAALEAAYRETRRTGEPRTVEFRTEPGVGTEWIECQIQPFVEDGSLASVIAVARDVTQYKRRERRLERQNEQFDRLASVISHDLRSPISTVRGRLELARETGDLDHVADALSAVDRLEELRADLVEMLHDDSTVGETERVDVATAAAGAWEGVSSHDGSTLETVGDPTIEGDPEATRRLLQNLLSNAVEHAEGPTTIRVGPCDAGFYVEDDGPGIDPADRSAVFEAGFSTKSDGTGMGMASVAQIVADHGWSISLADAAELGGARFEITS